MNEDSDLEKILDKIAFELARKSKAKKMIEINDEHGIYVRREDGWVLYRKDGGPFQLGELGDKLYIVYFDNTRCPACRIYDQVWYEFTDKHYSQDTAFVVVLCKWFSHQCDSEAASRTFLEYGIRASPTTVFAKTIDGEVVYSNRVEGVIREKTLFENLVLLKNM